MPPFDILSPSQRLAFIAVCAKRALGELSRFRLVLTEDVTPLTEGTATLWNLLPNQKIEESTLATISTQLASILSLHERASQFRDDSYPYRVLEGVCRIVMNGLMLLLHPQQGASLAAGSGVEMGAIVGNIYRDAERESAIEWKWQEELISELRNLPADANNKEYFDTLDAPRHGPLMRFGFSLAPPVLL